jgi:glycerophosphoryl diester phosphodiesterase
MTTTDRTLFTSRPDIVGHRGLGKGVVDGHVENTLASIEAAVAAGVDWVELDVSRTLDDVLVVHHNPATADGGFLVDRRAADLSAAGVSTLDEVLDALPVEVALDLDLKSVLEDATASPGATTPALLLPVLRRELARRRLLVTSFDAASLDWFRGELPGLPCGLLFWLEFPLRIAVPMAARFRFPVVGLHYRSFAANTFEPGPVHRDLATNVAVAHEAGLEVLAWCPGESEVGALVGAGVDAVCVNDVPRMLPAVRRLAAGDGASGTTPLDAGADPPPR